MSELPAQRFLLQAIAVLDGLGLPYIVIGGFAVRTWGVPRPTYDADLAVAVPEPALPNLLQKLEDAGFGVPDGHRAGFLDVVCGMRKFKVTRFDGATVWDVDLFVIEGPLLDSALLRGRSVTMSGTRVRVAAPEDLILLKLMAFRRKDQADIEEILRIAQDLDVAYLESWARRLNLEERLQTFEGPWRADRDPSDTPPESGSREA